MAGLDDYEDEEASGGTVDPNWDPGLRSVVDALDDPAARASVGAGAAILNDYVQKRNIADDNVQAGQNLENDVSGFEGGLTNFVSEDPHSVFAAMEAVPHVLGGVIHSVPGLEDPDAIHTSMTEDMQRNLARHAVRSLGETNTEAALGLLDHDRIKGLLTDEDLDALHGYVGAQAGAMEADRRAQEKQQAEATQRQQDGKAFSYMNMLHDTNENGAQFPPQWNQALIGDPGIPGSTKAVMHQAFARLQDGGDVRSDPWLVSQMVNRIADRDMENPRLDELFSNVGESLKLGDALYLGSLAAPQGHEAKAAVASLASALKDAREALIGPNGEGGGAGAAAYARFVDWFVPQYQLTGPAGLDENHPSFLLDPRYLVDFRPGGSDLPRPGATFGFQSSAQRPLGEIFGMGKVIPGTGIIDKGNTEQEIFDDDHRGHGGQFLANRRTENTDQDADQGMNLPGRSNRTGDTRMELDDQTTRASKNHRTWRSSGPKMNGPDPYDEEI